MKPIVFALAGALTLSAAPAFAADANCPASGDMVLSARTPEVDLFDAANGKRVKTIEQDKFPSCLPIAAQAPNMMLEVNVDGANYWVPPHMVNYRVANSGKPVCRKLAMGEDQAKVGATRGLGENCPSATTKGAGQ